jgi:hypothetical protein
MMRFSLSWRENQKGVWALEKLLLTMSGPVLQLLRVSYPGDSSRSQPNKREPKELKRFRPG